MKNPDKTLQGIDWATIFKRRPDLEPPGYRETVDLIYSKGANDESTGKRDA